GIKIIHNRSKRLIALSLSAYLEKILKKFRVENSKNRYTLMMEKSNYRKSQGARTPTEVQRMQRVPYASTISSIMYAVRCTRPDIAFAQNLCSRFQQNPGEIHWIAVKTILKYLRNTKDMVLVYGEKPKDELKVACYADASTTAMSSTEAEYIAVAEALMEAVWMRKFIDGLGDVMPSNKRPMEMLCDNEPALAIAIDSFTKPMPFNKHFEHVMAIGIVLAGSLMFRKKFRHWLEAFDKRIKLAFCWKTRGFVFAPLLLLLDMLLCHTCDDLYGCCCPKHKQYDYQVDSPGVNFTNQYRNLRIVLRYKKNMKFVEQLIGSAPDPKTADPDTIDKYYEFVNLEQEEDGQSVSSYLLKMKSYLDTLERLGYAMPKELGTLAELHAMLKLHENGIPKKVETPTVLSIREGKFQKDRKKPQKAKGKAKGNNKLAYAPKTKIPSPPKRDNLAKDSICH
ncbi:hypothetical protein Tco_1163523, partial [Tanacetum coccineum]